MCKEQCLHICNHMWTHWRCAYDLKKNRTYHSRYLTSFWSTIWPKRTLKERKTAGLWLGRTRTRIWLGLRVDSKNGFTHTWACNMHWKRMKREANGFCARPLPVHCHDLHNQNIPERLNPVFDRMGESVPGYRCGLRWCKRCYQTADQHFKNEPHYQPPKKVFFILFFKMKVT